jgi:hypothetical protein
MTVQDLYPAPDRAQACRHGEGIAAGFQNQHVFISRVPQRPVLQLLQFDPRRSTQHLRTGRISSCHYRSGKTVRVYVQSYDSTSPLAHDMAPLGWLLCFTYSTQGVAGF